MSGSKRISSLISPSVVVTSLQRKQATSPILKPAQCVSSIIDLLRAAYLRVLICVNKRSISAVVSVFACAMVLFPKSCVCVNCIVFSYIYLDNLSPAKLSVFWVEARRNELTVDNFFTVFFFNDFNAQMPKCVESYIARDFSWINRVSCG